MKPAPTGGATIVYQYVAYNDNRELVKGKLEARSEEHATELLNFAGYQLVNLKQIASLPSLGKLYFKFFPVKPTDIILFFRQMALLVESGLSIVAALELLEDQTTNKSFKKILGEIITDVRGGSQFSVALGKYPHVFSSINCQSLKVGEQTGGMEVIMRQIADYMEKQVNAAKGVKSAMTYPVIALVVAAVVIAIMVTFVLPAFNSLYTNLGVKLPAVTQFVLDLGNKLRTYGLYIFGALILLIVAFMAYIRTTKGRYQWDQVSLKMPLVGKINHLNELSKMCRNISALFKAGLPLTEILPLVIQSTGNKVVVFSLTRVRDEMLGGEGLSRPMLKHPVFLPMMVQMVRVGEETGNLDATLQSVAQAYETEASDRTKALISLIQPVMTLVIGAVVAVMALSLMSAMYSMYSAGGLGG